MSIAIKRKRKTKADWASIMLGVLVPFILFGFPILVMLEKNALSWTYFILIPIMLILSYLWIKRIQMGNVIYIINGESDQKNFQHAVNMFKSHQFEVKTDVKALRLYANQRKGLGIGLKRPIDALVVCSNQKIYVEFDISLRYRLLMFIGMILPSSKKEVIDDIQGKAATVGIDE